MEGVLAWHHVGVALGYGVLFAALGYFVYDKLKWRFAEVL